MFDASSTRGTEESSGSVPNRFEISKCYPNPFNPITNIELAIPSKEQVEVSVYNLLGQKLVSLVNEEIAPGLKRITFDGSQFSSGMYIVRAESKSGLVDTQKVMLLK